MAEPEESSNDNSAVEDEVSLELFLKYLNAESTNDIAIGLFAANDTIIKQYAEYTGSQRDLLNQYLRQDWLSPFPKIQHEPRGLLRQYIEQSPDCADLFQLWQNLDKVR